MCRRHTLGRGTLARSPLRSSAAVSSSLISCPTLDPSGSDSPAADCSRSYLTQALQRYPSVSRTDISIQTRPIVGAVNETIGAVTHRSISIAPLISTKIFNALYVTTVPTFQLVSLAVRANGTLNCCDVRIRESRVGCEKSLEFDYLIVGEMAGNLQSVTGLATDLVRHFGAFNGCLKPMIVASIFRLLRG